eukprot:121879_1
MSTTKYQRIRAKLIIPGSGSPIRNGCVIIKNNTITYVGEDQNQPKNIDKFDNDMFVEILMPGLWDCHVHFMGLTNLALAQHKGDPIDIVATTPAAIAVGRSIQSLSKCIEYGITSVREVGGYGYYLKKLVNEGSVIGPNIYTAGKMLSITGGHGDFHNFPLDFMCHLSHTDNITMLVDGNTECLKAVRKNIRNGADVIKIHATGGVLSINDALDSRQFGDNELKTIVNEARRSGTIVAAHCHGRDGIEACIDNGVYTIEHGSYLDDALAKKMKEKGIMLVPTRYIVEWLNESVEKDESKFNEKSMAKLKDIIASHRNSIKIAMKYGVKIAAGTDMAFDFWGENSKELEYYVEAGMSELEAIECGTSNCPDTLGPHKNIKSGQIKVGYDADIIALTKNPLENIKVLQDAKNIVVVWKNGRILKNILNDIKTIKSKL